MDRPPAPLLLVRGRRPSRVQRRDRRAPLPLRAARLGLAVVHAAIDIHVRADGDAAGLRAALHVAGAVEQRSAISALRTASASALRVPTRTQSRLPRVTAV